MNKKYPRASPPDTLRSERDRRVDEILSGRSSQQQGYHDSPASSSASSALSVNEGHNDSMKLKPNLISFGGTVKHKLGGLFGSSKSNPDNNTPSPQLPESSTTAAPSNHHSGRIFGRAAPSAVTNDNHRPYKNNTTRHGPEEEGNNPSRPISPNPFLMASSGINRQTSHNSNVSPFARFDGNNSRTSPTPSNNIFDDI